MKKLGTTERPAIVKVQTQERAEQILTFCDSKGWHVIVGIEPEEEEDITDVERLINPPRPMVSEKIDRNAPCTCGSGMKYKKCCGR